MAKKSPLKLCGSLQEAIQSLLDLNTPSKLREISIEKIADEMNVHPNNIYRWGAEPGTSSYAPLTIDNLRKLQDLTGNLAVLDYFERRYNRIAIIYPKVILPKNDEDQLIDEYRELTANVTTLLLKYFKQPSKELKTELDITLGRILKLTASLQKYCDKKAAGQYELNY